MDSANRAGLVGRREPGSIRRWNEFAVVSALREHSPQRVSELVARTGLTVATMGAVLRAMQSRGWVDVGEPISGGVGRPAQLFSLRIPSGSVIGLDVGAHAVRCVRLDLQGNLLARAEWRLAPETGLRRRQETVAAVIEQCRAGDTGPVWLTGLAVGGLLDTTGTVIESVAVPAFNGENPAEQLAGALPGRAVVINDVRAASVAEHQAGAARGIDEVLLLQLGRRPALGILCDGRLRRGAHGTAGDLSRTYSFPTEERMSWLKPFRDGGDPLGDAVKAAAGGDVTTLEGVLRYVSEVTPSLVVATAVIDPGMVVIGGALSPLADKFLDDVSAAVAAGVNRPPAVVVSQLDQFATAHGAGMVAIRGVWESLADPTSGVAPFTLEEFEKRPLPLVGSAA